jgi:RNA:NAD 2'-phosphotransferase (TPT1/KptA family)
MEIPEVLYHATLKENVTSILSNGLNVGCDYVSYFADTPEGAASFVYFRAVAQKKAIAVIEILTEDLNKSLFREGIDHSPEFFKDIQVFVYPEYIPPDCFSDNLMIYDLSHPNLNNDEDDVEY